jgi:phage shock protein A
MDVTDKKIKKSFFKKREGKAGILFLIALVLGGSFLLWKGLPFIIALFSNILTAGLVVGAVIGLVWLFSNKQFRTVLWYGFKMLMKKITRIFYKTDPIAIVETYVDDLNKNLNIMNENIGKLRGEIKNLDAAIGKNKNDMFDLSKIMKQAKKQKNITSFRTSAHKIGRLKEQNKKYQALYDKMWKLMEALTKMYEVAGIKVEELQYDIELQKREYQTIKKGHLAMKSGIKAMVGDDSKRQVFEETMDYMQKDLNNKVGEMEHFMDFSKKFIESIDIQNGIFEDEALEMLEKWEQNDYDSLMKTLNETENISALGEMEKELEPVLLTSEMKKEK